MTENKATFGRWLMAQAFRDDTVGDVANLFYDTPDATTRMLVDWSADDDGERAPGYPPRKVIAQRAVTEYKQYLTGQSSHAEDFDAHGIRKDENDLRPKAEVCGDMPPGIDWASA